MTISDSAIRPARAGEYDEIARIWMVSWVSTGLDTATTSLRDKLRARIPVGIANGWSLFVAEDGGRLAAMLALNLPENYLDQLFVAPEYQGRSFGRRLLAFTRTQLPDEIRCAACARTKGPGAGMSGRALCSSAKHMSRRSTG